MAGWGEMYNGKQILVAIITTAGLCKYDLNWWQSGIFILIGVFLFEVLKNKNE